MVVTSTGQSATDQQGTTTMTSTSDATYKTIAGGSIDYAHYISNGHRIRSEGAHAGLAAIWKVLKAVFAVCALRFGTIGRTQVGLDRGRRHPQDRSIPRADTTWRRRDLPIGARSDAA